MKAVLVIDMPECCDECFMLDDSGDYPTCRFTQESRGYNFKVREKRMDRCPLRSVPEKDYEIFLGQWSIGYKEGWNKCIDMIVGDTNEIL